MYTAVTDDQIIVIINGKSKSVSRGSAISAKLLEELSKPHPDEGVVAKLIDVKSAFTEYTDSDLEIMYDGTVTRNGDALPAVLAQKVVECFRNGVDYQYLLNFFDNLNANPSRRAVEELYGFLAHGGMPITPDGCFLAYKGLDNEFWSISAGSKDKVIKGKVNDSGHIFNGVGEEIEVERNYVDDDARVACSHGLHVGSESYAMDFARGKVVIVKTNPKDVVSVPHDCDCQKLRTCAYTVVAEHIGTLGDGGVSDDRNPYNTASRVVDKFDYSIDGGADTYADENEYDDEDEDEADDEPWDDDGNDDNDDNDDKKLEVKIDIHNVNAATEELQGLMRKLDTVFAGIFGHGTFGN